MSEEFEVEAQEIEQGLEEVTNEVEANEDLEQDVNNEEKSEPTEKTFTQAELDEIIGKRLSRERSKLEQEQANYKQQARDEYIASQGYQWNGKVITTEAEYKQALNEHKMINELIENKGFSQEQAAELARDRSERERIQKELEDLKRDKKQTEDIEDVMQWHDKMHQDGIFNEAFDYKNIPDDILGSDNLKVSYMEWMLKNMKVQTEQSVLKNMRNKKDLSTGSVEDVGGDESTLSFDTINKYGNDPAWVKKNYDRIVKSGYFK